MKYKLSDLFDLQMGKTPSRSNPEYWHPKDNKWISISDLTNSGMYINDTKEYISNKAVEESNIKIIPKNTVIMSFKLSIGKTAITAEPIYSNEAIMSFIDKGTAEIDLDYTYYLLSHTDWSIGSNKAVKGKTLNKATISNTTIDIPDYKTQKQIAQRLNIVSKIIEHKKRQIGQLDNLVNTHFIETFKGKGFQKVTLSELTTGKVPTVKRDFSPDSRIKYIDISSIDSKNNQMTGFTEYILKDAPSRAQQHIQRNDIIVSTVRPNLKNVAITTYDDSCLVASSGFCVLRPKDNISPEYLLSIVCSDDFTYAMSDITNGANYPAIHDSDVLSYVVELPPIEIQREYSEFWKTAYKAKTVLQKSLAKTQLLLDSLMQEYFG